MICGKIWSRRRFRGAALHFLTDERGQDLIEYTLLLAFVSLSGAALYIGMGATMNNIWGIVNTRLAAANQSASS